MTFDIYSSELAITLYTITDFCKSVYAHMMFFFFFQAEDGIRDLTVTGVQTCALPICSGFDIDVHHRAPGASEFGAHGIGLDAELGDGVGRGSIHIARLVGQVLREAVVVDAVEQIAVLVGANAIRAEASGALIARSRSRGQRAGRQYRQAREEPAVERKILD